MTIIAKDVGIVMDEARLNTFPAPMCSVAEQVFTAALGAGLAREDDGLVSKVWELFGGKPIPEKGTIAEEEEHAKELSIQSSSKPHQVLFIGTGAMGAGMALSIQKDGIPIVSYDMNPDARNAVESGGGKVSEDPLSEAKNADVVVLMPATALQAEAVLFGAAGAPGLVTGK